MGRRDVSATALEDVYTRSQGNLCPHVPNAPQPCGAHKRRRYRIACKAEMVDANCNATLNTNIARGYPGPTAPSRDRGRAETLTDSPPPRTHASTQQLMTPRKPPMPRPSSKRLTPRCYSLAAQASSTSNRASSLSDDLVSKISSSNGYLSFKRCNIHSRTMSLERTSASTRTREPACLSKEIERRETLEMVLWKQHSTKQETVAAFLQRYGLLDTKLFVLDGPDEHIRKALYDRSPSWAENPRQDSMIWHLKWRPTDCAHDYESLQDGDLFNHFEGNRALTTKAGLMRSLQQLKVECHDDVDSFFPRSYDMSQASEREDFVLDFRRCAALQLLRQHRRLASAATYSAHNQYKCNVSVLQLAADVLIHWQQDLDGNYFEEENRPRRVISDQEWDALVLYSELTDSHLMSPNGCAEDVPYTNAKRLGFSASGSAESCAQVGGLTGGRVPHRSQEIQSWPEFARHCWTVELPVGIATEVHRVLEGFEGASRSSQLDLQGQANAWIVKPGTNSKGSGVMCMNSLPKILHHCGKVTNRVVQKYIERPLLLFSGRKFDIRQWVLVRSFEPLEAYVFSDCYLRLCNEPFDLGDLTSRQRHISNWAINKNGKPVTEGAVASLEQFCAELLDITGHSGYWDEVLRPKILSIITRSLRGAKSSIVHRSTCFELYGFDILIDEMLNPWLLEVNLSPACESRTPWIATMLQRMASRLLDIVVDGNCEPDGILPDWVAIDFYDTDSTPGSATLLPEVSMDPAEDTVAALEAAHNALDTSRIKDGTDATSGLPVYASALSVVGHALNFRAERRLDIAWRRLEASHALQHAAKGYLARRKFRLAQHAARRVQRTWRQWRARIKAITMVLPHMRELLQRVRLKIKRRRMAVKNLQRHLRCYVSKTQLRQKYITLQAIEVQRHWRGYIDRRRACTLRQSVFATRLQKCWRSRLEQQRRLAAAIQLQAYARRVLACKRCKHIKLHVANPAQGLLLTVLRVHWRRLRLFNKFVNRLVFLQQTWRSYTSKRKERRRKAVLLAAVQRIQRRWRGQVLRRRVIMMQVARRRIQAAFRRHLKLKHRKGAECLQRWWRRCLHSRMTQERLRFAGMLRLQRWWRHVLYQKLQQRRRAAALQIQAAYRRYSERRKRYFGQRMQHWRLAFTKATEQKIVHSTVMERKQRWLNRFAQLSVSKNEDSQACRDIDLFQKSAICVEVEVRPVSEGERMVGDSKKQLMSSHSDHSDARHGAMDSKTIARSDVLPCIKVDALEAPPFAARNPDVKSSLELTKLDSDSQACEVKLLRQPLHELRSQPMYELCLLLQA